MTAARVLIVDDDRDFAEGMAEALELHGHRIDVAFAGETAVEAVSKGPYDAVLIDVGLPGMNGVETLIKIRKVAPDVPCFLLTGHSADHLAGQGIEAGAVTILTKPVNPDEILQLISECRCAL